MLLNHESIALQCYEKQTKNKVKKCGLFIDENLNYMAASPDGILDDNTAVVEVKCPYKYRYNYAEEVDYVKNFDNFETHQYYMQCQLQMKICKVKYCDFVVYTTKNIIVKRVYK